MKIGLVAPVKPSHPYLENDPAPLLDLHYLRISPWLWFSITTTGYQNGPRFWSLANASDAHIKMALPPPMRSRKRRRLNPSL